MTTVENILKMCRVCCVQQTNNNLIFLLDAKNKTIVKKLRACADITVSTATKKNIAYTVWYGYCVLRPTNVYSNMLQFHCFHTQTD